MGKKKKGRLRGKGGGMYGNNPRNNRPRPYRDPMDGGNNNYHAPSAEFPDNGEPGPLVAGGGVLEMHPNGYGFLRDPEDQLHAAS